MRFFSRIVAICNVCFIVTIIMRYIEMDTAKKSGEAIARLPLLQNTLVILGYSAIIMNFILVLVCLYMLLAKKVNNVPRLLLIFNLLVFACQIIFHFDLF